MFGGKKNKDQATASLTRRLNAISDSVENRTIVAPSPKTINPRRSPRKAVFKFAVVEFGKGESLRCVVKDVSPFGAQLALEGAIGLPETFLLTITGFRAKGLVRRAWQNEDRVGVEYKDA